MKLVWVRNLPPVGPSSAPITCSNRQAMEPVFGQLAISAEGWIACCVCAHTLLVSNELCHVALPKARGLGANLFGFVLGLRKCVMIWTCCPKKLVKSVASGRAWFTVHAASELPSLVGRQTYPCVPRACPTRNAVAPTGGVMRVGVGGDAMFCAVA